MKFELFDYQELAKAIIARSLLSMVQAYEENTEERGAVVLAAPTGAGKTVIATAVIEPVLDGDETTPGVDTSTFLWVTDDPSLNRQTRNKMEAASPELAPKLITIENDFDQELFDTGRVYFLNIQKLASTATLSKSAINGRTYSVWETIANTVKRRPYGFVVIADEAHRGLNTNKDTRDTIVSRIIGGRKNGTSQPEAPIVWGISAVPRRFREEMAQRGRTLKSHTVAIEDVRASSLLKDQIILGHTGGLEAAESTLIRYAVEKIRDYETRWTNYCKENGDARVDPILVVQLHDKPSSKDLCDLVGTVLEEWPEITPANVAHTFASHATERTGSYEIRYCSPEDIQDRADVRVVLCKTAITTGWDCPRAEVLLSMRVAKDADLITQIMGRMVRAPLARRILTDETLNTVHCILPKFDTRTVDLIVKQFERGDESNLASGTRVVVKPVQLIRNPFLRSPASSDGETGTGEAATPQAPGTEPGEDTASFESDTKQVDSYSRTDRNTNNNSSASARSEKEPAQAHANSIDRSPTEESGPHDEQDVFEILQALPSYTIPKRTRRSGVTRLSALAVLLTEKHDGKAIESSAIRQARNELLALIDTFKANIAAKGELADQIAVISTIPLYERTVTYGSETENPRQSQTRMEIDSRGIRILMDRAMRRLPEGLAMAYVNRSAAADGDVTNAMITTIALTQDPELPALVEERASQLVGQWLQKYSSAITRLGAADQERFDRIRRESDRPLPTTFSLPTSGIEGDEGDVWERHALSDAYGKFRAKFRDWEEYVLRKELVHDAIAWYRNPSGGRHSLQIPYRSADGVKGMSPDFIFVHRLQGQLRASLIDPHGTHLADAVPKLKGLAEYAIQHGHAFHRIQSVAMIGGKYLMLNHQDRAMSEAIRNFYGIEADELFCKYGSDY